MFALLGTDPQPFWYHPNQWKQIGINTDLFYTAPPVRNGFSYTYNTQTNMPGPGPWGAKLQEMALGYLGASYTETSAPKTSEWAKAVKRYGEFVAKNERLKVQLKALNKNSPSYKDLNAFREWIAGEMLAAQNYLNQNDPRFVSWVQASEEFFAKTIEQVTGYDVTTSMEAEQFLANMDVLVRSAVAIGSKVREWPTRYGAPAPQEVITEFNNLRTAIRTVATDLNGKKVPIKLPASLGVDMPGVPTMAGLGLLDPATAATAVIVGGIVVLGFGWLAYRAITTEKRAWVGQQAEFAQRYRARIDDCWQKSGNDQTKLQQCLALARVATEEEKKDLPPKPPSSGLDILLYGGLALGAVAILGPLVIRSLSKS